MHKLQGAKRKMIAVAAAVAVTAGLGGSAYAVSTLSGGTVTDIQRYATNDTGFAVPAVNTWTNLPNMAVTVVIPAGQRRLLEAEYNAETLCTGGGWCSVRVLYQKVNVPVGPVTIMRPIGEGSGVDFAFASAGSGAGARSADRNSGAFLPAGTYRVWVQGRRVGATGMGVDEQHFRVGAVRP